MDLEQQIIDTNIASQPNNNPLKNARSDLQTILQAAENNKLPATQSTEPEQTKNAVKQSLRALINSLIAPTSSAPAAAD